jgi:hypothetical protein
MLKEVLSNNKLEVFVLSLATPQDREVMSLVKINGGEKMEKYQ